MNMTNEEIIREYREAKTPLKQIGILADKNQCSRGKIVEILREAGIELPAVYREKPKLDLSGFRPFQEVADAAETGNAPAAAGSPHQSPAGDSFPQGKPGTETNVYAAALEVIAWMVADSDKSTDRVTATLNLRERVRGVLAMAYELRRERDE